MNSNSNYGAPKLEVQYIQLPQGHTPTWRHILPQTTPNGMRLRLTAINKWEFTIFSMRDGCSIPELTKQIQKISKSYGGAVYERKGFPCILGKWRIPMDAFDDLVAYLKSDCSQYELEFNGLKDKEGAPTVRIVQQRYRKSRLKDDLKIEPHYQFNNLRLRTVTYPGPIYGLIMVSCYGRVVVKSHTDTAPFNPEIGSIIVSCNGYNIP